MDDRDRREVLTLPGADLSAVAAVADDASAQDHYQDIRQALNVLIERGAVAELRVLKTRQKTVSGYFDNPDHLAAAAKVWDGKAPAVYVTLNEVNPALLARSANKVKGYAEHTTSDTDILRRRWLPIDLDPVRPADISSTDEEHAAALALAREVRDWLAVQGWPANILADSGNGAHLLYPIDLPNDAESADLVRGSLEALAFRFSNDAVAIDQKVFNAARIWKVYGTLACKGDSTVERPHRRARLLEVPDRLDPVPVDLLQALATMRPKVTEQAQPVKAGWGAITDLDTWLEAHGIEVYRNGPWGNGGRRWVIRCPWNPEHTDRAAYVVQLPGGAIDAGCHHNGCAGKGWHDLRDAVEPGWRDRRGQDGKAPARPAVDAEADEIEVWPVLGPLPPELPAAPTLPPEMVPEVLRPWLVDVADRACIPLEYAAAPAVVGLGALIGRQVGIRPSHYDDWLVVPNLWGGIIGRPGTMKSTAVQEALKPLHRLAALASARHKEELSTWDASALGIKARMEASKKRLLKAATEGKDMADIQGELQAHMEELQAAEPTERRYMTQDATVEKLGELLQQNPRGLLVFRDELAGWLRTLDKPGREGDREFYLESWNGTGGYTFDRIERGTVHVPAVCLAVVGGIQPGKLRSYVTDALGEGSGNDGLLQRLQVLVWPDRTGEWRQVDRWPDSQAKQRVYAAFEALDEIDVDTIGAIYGDGDDIPHLRFSVGGQTVWDAWRDQLERRLRSDELAATPAYEAHLSKYRSLMPSLALIFHLLDPRQGGVTEDAARLAAAWCEFLEAHARKVYADEVAPGQTTAHRLASKIRDGSVRDRDGIRDIHRHEWSGLTTQAAVRAGLSVLEVAGWVRVERVETGGRPSEIVRLHPELRGDAE